MKRLLIMIVAVIMLSAAGTALASSADTKYYKAGYTTPVSHRFNTGALYLEAKRVWLDASDYPNEIIYVNENNPADTLSDYHCVRFIADGGQTICSYMNVYSGGSVGITTFGSYASTPSLRAQIKNQYYGTSQSYYKMKTKGNFYAH